MESARATDVRVSVATPDEAEAILEVFYRVWLTTYPNVEHGITLEDVEDWHKDRHSERRLAIARKRIARGHAGQVMLVAHHEEAIVGVCRAGKNPERNYLAALYVLPEYQDRGIGTALWQTAQQHFDKTLSTIVDVATYNLKAIGFYQHLGFVETGKRMNDPKFTMKSGNIIPMLEMEVRVAR